MKRNSFRTRLWRIASLATTGAVVLQITGCITQYSIRERLNYFAEGFFQGWLPSVVNYAF